MRAENDKVGDDELLYRAVQHGKRRVENVNGELKPTRDCFLDPSFEISVDRAVKCQHNPVHLQRQALGYFCCLLTGQVRAIKTVVRQNADGSVAQNYSMKVWPDPLLPHCLTKDRSQHPENPAHALIFGDPYITNDRVFRRMRAALAQITTWEPNFAPNEPN